MTAVDVDADAGATAERIASMEIRGAATIAGEAAGALGTQAEHTQAARPEEFHAEFRTAARLLLDTRPTAVSLPNVLRFVFERIEGNTVEALGQSIIAGASQFQTQLATAQDDLGAIDVNNPAFDVPPPSVVDTTVTERGQSPLECIVIINRELFGEHHRTPWEE